MNKKIIVFALIALGIAVVFAAQKEPSEDNTSMEPEEEDLFSKILSPDDPVLGSPNAPITIVALNDYQCKGCKAWYLQTLPKIKESFVKDQKAKVVFINVDLLGGDSLRTARAAYCAHDQGKFLQYQEQLFLSETDSWTPESLKALASEISLDIQEFEDCLSSGKFEDKVRSKGDTIRAMGIRLPTYIMINEDGRHHIFKDVTPFGAFEQIMTLWS